MTITFKGVREQIDVDQLLYVATIPAEAIARKMLLNMLESQIDMISDGEPDVQTKVEIEKLLNTELPETTIEYFNDLWEDIGANIRSFIKLGAEVKVRALEYNTKGDLCDVSVDVKFNQFNG